MTKKFSISLLLISALAMSFALIQNWSIGNGNKVTFKIGSAMGTVNGSIGGLKGNVNFDPQNPSGSNMDVTLDLSTIMTGNNKRDKDIKEEDTWFNIAKYPTIAFKSNSLAKTAHGYTVDGMLTIKGIVRKVQIPFAFANNTFTGSLKLNRLDYGVGKSTIMVKDTVEVTIVVPVK
jgi:polyisoprenoid-binding protein YceI